ADEHRVGRAALEAGGARGYLVAAFRQPAEREVATRIADGLRDLLSVAQEHHLRRSDDASEGIHDGSAKCALIGGCRDEGVCSTKKHERPRDSEGCQSQLRQSLVSSRELK